MKQEKTIDRVTKGKKYKHTININNINLSISTSSGSTLLKTTDNNRIKRNLLHINKE